MSEEMKKENMEPVEVEVEIYEDDYDDQESNGASKAVVGLMAAAAAVGGVFLALKHSKKFKEWRDRKSAERLEKAGYGVTPPAALAEHEEAYFESEEDAE